MAASKDELVTPISLVEVIRDTLFHWKWIVLSVCVFLAFGFIYIFTAKPEYGRSAEVLLRNDGNMGGTAAALSALGGLNLLGGANAEMVDEVNKMLSPDLLLEVIQRHDLQMDVKVDGLLRKEDVYGANAPFTVQTPGLMPNQGVGFKVKVNEEGMVVVSKIKLYNKKDPNYEKAEDFKQGTPVKLGTPIKTPIGEIIVNQGPAYKAGEDYKLTVNRVPIKSAISGLTAKLMIDMKEKMGKTILLEVQDGVAERAEDILGSIIEFYDEREIGDRDKMVEVTNQFINDRLAVVEKELGKAEDEYYQYRSNNMISDMGKAAEIYLEQNASTEQQIAAQQNNIEIAKMLRAQLLDNTRVNEILPANSGFGNEAIEKQILDYNNTMFARNRTVRNSSENHPAVVEYDSQLAGLRKGIIQSLDNSITSMTTRLNTMKRTEAKQLAKMEGAPMQAKQLVDLGRERSLKENMYLFLLQKREENQLSQLTNSMSPDIVLKPYGVDRPVKPRKGMSLAVAFVLGFIFPFIFNYGRELLNTKALEKADLNNLGIDVVGEIPLTKQAKNSKGRKTNHPVIALDDNRVTEAFRNLRTNLKKVQSGLKQGYVILVTSLKEDAGKTFVSLNLAEAYASNGSKTLVIDADNRNRLMSSLFGGNSKGYLGYLEGSASDWRNTAVKVGNAGFALLSLSDGEQSPDLFESANMARLIDEAKQNFDIIIIDTPDMDNSATAKIFSDVADRCLMVVRIGTLSVKMIGQLKELLRRKVFSSLDAVLDA